MIEQDAIVTIMRSRYQRNLCLPRFTPDKWWQCDVFELTDAGYYREYEVKLTRSDFKADAKKKHQEYGTYSDNHTYVPGPTNVKHELLQRGDTVGPVMFWYVTPVGLIERSELPPWAGLIELEDRGAQHTTHWRYSERTIVTPPRIHNSKCLTKVRDHALQSCYYRMHSMLLEGNIYGIQELSGSRQHTEARAVPGVQKEVDQSNLHGVPNAPLRGI